MTKKKAAFAPASAKQALMLKRASDTQVTIIGGAAKLPELASLKTPLLIR